MKSCWTTLALTTAAFTAGATTSIAQGRNPLVLPPLIDGTTNESQSSADVGTSDRSSPPGSQPPAATATTPPDSAKPPDITAPTQPRGTQAVIADAPADLPLEEIIVINESEWRLPDLGSNWRAAQEEESETGRIELTFVPLYDPENEDPVQDLFQRNSELHRMELIEIFRVRFGGRPRD